jgi:hypothetical protein
MLLRAISLVLISLAMISGHLEAQTNPEAEREFDSLYAIRIELEEIDGVYIPEDLNDAFNELSRLSSDADIEKFREADEDVVRDKLHFGLGRWMIHNWGFYQGSRLSHYLKGLGLEHPDDMAKFLVVSYHRHLNDEPLRIEEQVAVYKEYRDRERLKREQEKEVIHSETRIKKND